jgi:hypothetical protein
MNCEYQLPVCVLQLCFLPFHTHPEHSIVINVTAATFLCHIVISFMIVACHRSFEKKVSAIISSRNFLVNFSPLFGAMLDDP